MSLHERLKRIEDRLAKLEQASAEQGKFLAQVSDALAEEEAADRVDVTTLDGEAFAAVERDQTQSLG